MIVVATTEKDDETQSGEPAAPSEDSQDTEDTSQTSDIEVDSVEHAEAESADDDEDNTLLADKREKAARPNRSWVQYLRRGAMPLLLAGALALSAFLGWQQWQQHQVKLAGQQARQAAVAYAQVLTSIDSNNVDQNFRQVLDGATGEFKDMYTQSSVQLRQLLIDNKASAHGVVVDSAVASETVNKVVVLVFVDQTVTNMAVPDPRIDRSRIKMTMEKVDGRWLASKVQLL
ncbi:tetratricopeptide repeat protein [Mycobacterium marinum]|uniref:tetratricopeptide repeat protein n=1 Tax=Mycobacterium marinum TaxID=1781 RepID=UPI0019230AE2|nr:tetratricopeptide repeat protein [Mycobacterium marinum]QQW36733.1 tetratricopeptide repeat protein [Mycobacterium marinum]